MLLTVMNAKYIISLLLLLLFSSCITYEKKDVSFRLNRDGSISVCVKYYNIVSENRADPELYNPKLREEGNGSLKYAAALEICRGDSILAHDLCMLQNRYLGIAADCIESEYQGAVIESKRLFEENGSLCGEITMKIAPEIYLANADGLNIWYDAEHRLFVKDIRDTEYIERTNGVLKKRFPFMIIWQNVRKPMNYTCYKRIPAENDTTCSSLLPYWKKATGN